MAEPYESYHPGEAGLRGWVGRALGARPGELGALALSAAYFFCLLFSYYMLRPVREAMGIDRGYDKLAWLMTGTLVAMAAVNPVFGWMVSKWPRRVFIPAANRFFLVNILFFAVLFAALPESGQHRLGYAFYIWLSVFNLFVISVFWAFMADTWRREGGKRLFGVVGVGGTLGAMGGAAFTARFADDLTTVGLLVASAVVLEGATQAMRGVYRIRHRRESGGVVARPEMGRSGNTPNPSGLADSGTSSAGGGAGATIAAADDRASRASAAEPGPGALEGLRLIAHSPYLLTICLYMLIFTTTQTLVYMEQGRVIEATFPDRAARTAAFASLDFWTNALTLLTQLFLTGRVIRWIGVGGALTIIPSITLLGFVAMLVVPNYVPGAAFATLFVFQVVRRGLHYAIDRPARELLFTVVGPDERYKSKSFIDTFVYRAGDMLGGWTPIWIKALFKIEGVWLSAVAIPMAGAWIGVAGVLGWMQTRVAAKHRQKGPPL